MHLHNLCWAHQDTNPATPRAHQVTLFKRTPKKKKKIKPNSIKHPQMGTDKKL